MAGKCTDSLQQKSELCSLIVCIFGGKLLTACSYQIIDLKMNASLSFLGSAVAKLPNVLLRQSLK